VEICGVESAHKRAAAFPEWIVGSVEQESIVSARLLLSCVYASFLYKALKSELLMLLAVCYYNNITQTQAHSVCFCITQIRITSDGNSWLFEIITDKFNR